MVAPSFCIVLIPGKDCTEVVEICVPTVATTCKNTSVPRQEYREIPKTYKVNNTICKETIQVIPQEVCSYFYEQSREDIVINLLNIDFLNKSAILTPSGMPTYISYPKRRKECVKKPIRLPLVLCSDVTSEVTYNIPTIVDTVYFENQCTNGLGQPYCYKREIVLPFC